MKKELIAMMSVLMMCGCMQYKIESNSQVNVKPIEIKPIHITIDINVKVDRALDDFFGDIDKETAKDTKNNN